MISFKKRISEPSCAVQFISIRSNLIRCFYALVILCLASDPCFSEDLTGLLKPIIDRHSGQVAVVIKHLETGEKFYYREKECMPTASLIKFPVLIEYYKQVAEGTIAPDATVIVRDEDKVPGSGILTEHFLEGTVLPLETAAHLMITYSDNTATNLVLDQIGITSVIETMRGMGCPETQIHSKVFRQDTSVAPDRSQKYGLGSTTAEEMLTLLELLHAGKIVSEDISDRILGHLVSCNDQTKLMRFLPKVVKGFHKTGSVNKARTDAGLFETPNGWIAMVCLTSENVDTSWGDNNAAEILCGRIAEVAYEYFNPVKREVAEPQLLRIGANGKLVELLQVGLNQRLKPSPRLSVDGDFGMMTEQAVIRFRREHGLEEVGVVDEVMWQKLGKIDEGRAADGTDQEELAAKKPADLPEGIPAVSGKAWVVADAESGEILAGERYRESLDIASTTKMMTALLIANEIEAEPGLLDDLLTFSRRADETPGSSATVRVGESITIRDAFYGLLLPSGNDASVALAEWYSGRKDRVDPKTDPLDFFIKAMNDEAKRLKMDNTTFRNPHGLTHPEHKSSCEDLVILSRELMRHPFLREVVSTRRYSCFAKGSEGYQRRLVWNNSNQLLHRHGYLGIKTGTTDAAGACLVSMSDFQGRATIVVVLGASGSAARYADSRNLHRWSWTLDRD